MDQSGKAAVRVYVILSEAALWDSTKVILLWRSQKFTA